MLYGEASAMFTRRLRWWGLGAVLVLLLGILTLWLLMPPRIDDRIHPGMTRAEVETITGQAPRLSLVWSPAGCESYRLPDGMLAVDYERSGLDSKDRAKDVVVDRVLLRPASFEKRLRVWLGW
jgi:hypothetical protein